MKVMANAQQGRLTNNQAMFMLFSALVGIGVLALPQSAGKTAGSHAWLAVMLAGVIPLLTVTLMSLVGRRLPGLTLAEMNDYVFGSYLGKIFTLVYITYALTLMAIELRYFAFIVKSYLLPVTPAWVIILLTVVSASYLAAASIKVLGRVCELIFYLVIPAYFLVLPALSEASLLTLMPVGVTDYHAFLQGIFSSAFAYAGATLWLVILPFITRQEETLQTGLKAIVILIIVYVFFTVVAISIFGEGIKFIRWPVLMLLKTAMVPVIERIEFIFILLWIPTVYRVIAVSWWAAAYSATRMLQKTNHRPLVWVTLPLVLICALLPQDIFMLDKYAEWSGIMGISIDILLPISLLLGTVFRRKGGKVCA